MLSTSLRGFGDCECGSGIEASDGCVDTTLTGDDVISVLRSMVVNKSRCAVPAA